MKPYYEHAGITIYHGDCREILPTLDHGSAALVLTDPPYEDEAHTQQRRVKRGGGVMAIEALPFAPIDEPTRLAVARDISRLALRWVLTFCQIEAAPVWRSAYETGGLLYKRTCLWVKPDGMPQYSGDRPGMGYEVFLAMHSAAGRSRWNGGGRHGVWTVNKNESASANEHPTTKPLKLIKQLVGLFSDTDDAVLDPFMGSGTTLRAAKDLGRRAIGIEIEERYCEVAARRLSQEVLPFVEPCLAPLRDDPRPCGLARGHDGEHAI